ncbi:MAG: CDP-alcohol phosphatidyltransferase family protein [Gammaproteobacteria bacterium]|nr:CDP-alcohol phosphatidyltransferase family protein [Gammaproteobacteria bacterium]MDE0249001.1 CDP-alcohol phosphatidyltransferase family protein [Gammaproteobacteria bacterium]
MSTPVTPGGSRPHGLVARLRVTGPDLFATALALLAAAGATWWLLGLPATYLLHVAVLYVGFAALVVTGFAGAGGAVGIGVANRITLLRSTWVLAIGGLVLHDPVFPSAVWWIIALSIAAMVLDGVDGHVARRFGAASPFGARLDMEVDAFLLLVLSVLVWQGGKVGEWVLAVGGIRYFFVAAGWIWPPLRAELPASQRRKAVCVVQGAVLLACLLPAVPASAAALLAGTGLALLVYSFAVDVAWLAASGRTPGGSRREAGGEVGGNGAS